MSRDYQKINTLFKRDNEGIIIPSELTNKEFEYMRDCKWECTEKIDGTNIHIDLVTEEDGEERVEFHGRTEKAVIPAHLMAYLVETFPLEKIRQVFDLGDQPAGVTISIYGEGYGQKIQKCGKDYISNDVGFILFDVRVGHWWLLRKDCEEIASKLNVPIVPLVGSGYYTIDEAIEIVSNGFKSLVAENSDLQAEGLVLKTPCGMLDRSGQRIITKLKTCDFRKYHLKKSEGKENEQ